MKKQEKKKKPENKIEDNIIKLKKGKISKKYNKLVWAFISASILIVLFIGYFAFAKTTIIVYPTSLDEQVEFQVTLEDLEGELLQTEVDGTNIFSDFANMEYKEVEGKASGIVTIYNNYSADQPLVATTRLLSDEGVLFRTTHDVVVPKDSSIEVSVQADEDGDEANIGASTFEIVALNQAKKEFIYGESSEKMSAGITKIATLTEDDITNASNKLSEELIARAIEQLKQESENDDIINENNAEKTIIESDINAEVGDEVEQIEVYEKLKVSFLTYNSDLLLRITALKMEENLDMGHSILHNPTLDNINYQIISLDDDNAVIKITATGQKIINDKNSILHKQNIINKTKNRIITYFSNFDEIEKVEVQFSPFWVQTAPLLEDQINIEVK
ncbi:MAG: hypothetical protein ABID45_00195 [Patescibacteria group bacterium]